MEFPLDLDLAPFVVGPSSTSAQYRLYAVVNHSGSLSFGHYTAYCDLVAFEHTESGIHTQKKQKTNRRFVGIPFIVGFPASVLSWI